MNQPTYEGGARGRAATEVGGGLLDDLHPSQWLGLAVGLVFIVVGIAGFFVTGFDNFASHDTGEKLLIFEVNPLHNVVHLVIGLLAFAMCWTRRGTLAYGAIVAVGYAAAFVYGLAAIDKTWDFLSVNWEDNWLHLGLAVVGVLLALYAYADMRTTERRDVRYGTATRAERPPRGTAPA